MPGLPLLLSLLALTSSLAHGCFIITTPRRWNVGIRNIVCVMVSDPKQTAWLRVTLWRFEDQLRYHASLPQAVTRSINITLEPGDVNSCESMYVPRANKHPLRLRLEGRACGKDVFRQLDLSLAKPISRSFIQTDKFLYKPSQKVRFRILTIEKVTLVIRKLNYYEVWVTSPSDTRIAQWKDVDNSQGLIHLELELSDEPEMGEYTIHVKMKKDSDTFTQNFRVDEYVLPRFQVTLTPPGYVLIIDRFYTFTVCARYTFGQPVKGSLSLLVKNHLCKKSVTKVIDISGCQEVKVKAEQVKKASCNTYSLTVNATVTEAGTVTSVVTSVVIKVHHHAVIFRTLHQDQYMKPHLPFTFKIQAERPDKTPVSGEPIEVCCSTLCTNLTSGKDGTFTVTLSHCSVNTVEVKSLVCWSQLDNFSHTVNFKRYFSPSNTSLAIVAPEGTLRCSTSRNEPRLLALHFTHCGHTRFTLNIMVLSRGVIQYIGSTELNTREMERLDPSHFLFPLPPLPGKCSRYQAKFNISVSRYISPVIRVMVWYTREDGEVVSDSRMLEVEKCLNYQVQLGLESQLSQPGSHASIHLASEPNSLCSLSVVDKSVELLAPQVSGKLTLDKIFTLLDQYSRQPYFNNMEHENRYCRMKLDEEENLWATYRSKYVDALQMFDDSGLHVLSDATLETRPCEVDTSNRGPFPPLRGGAIALDHRRLRPQINSPPGVQKMKANNDNDDNDEDDDDDAPTDITRTDFPETWLWDLVFVPESGKVNQSLVLPDTITQWVGGAVCVHQQLGVGLSNQASLITFITLFVDLTLPPTIKQGEILHVKISVFNYVNIPLPVTTLLSSPLLGGEMLQFVDPENQSDPGRGSSCVPAQDKFVRTVKIRPRIPIGLLNLTVQAFVDNEAGLKCSSYREVYRDTIVKPIKVVAGGFPREKTFTSYLCPDTDTQDRLTNQRNIDLPHDIVPGSFRAWITISGDLMTLSLANLGSLIRMPSGCGEQILLNLAPNIFILNYLSSTKQDIPDDTEKKLIKYMENGYRKELNYKHPDGSYSAFGSRDKSGSTWLTAFVLKSFAQARPYIKVDSTHLKEAERWLYKQQGPDGCFLSVGRVIHKALKGGMIGRKTSMPLTAYVVISLLEAGNQTTRKLTDALRCLILAPSPDLYAMSIKSYALALANLPQSDKLINKLLTIGDGESRRASRSIVDDGNKKSAMAVEGVSYVVMAMMTRNPVTHRARAAKMVKWIVQQRNSQGGFVTTQATVVALQALALFSSWTTRKDTKLTVTINSKNLQRSLTVTNDNKLLQQLVTIPTTPTVLSYRAEGTGCVVIQTVMRYSNNKPSPSDAFSLIVRTNTEPDRTCITKRITVCATYLLINGSSNMAIIEVDLVSGYQAMKDDMNKVLLEKRDIFKRFEVEDDTVSFYVDHFDVGREVCVSFRVVREVTVEMVRPATVAVYDYYQPNFKISQSYQLPPSDDCNIRG